MLNQEKCSKYLNTHNAKLTITLQLPTLKRQLFRTLVLIVIIKTMPKHQMIKCPRHAVPPVKQLYLRDSDIENCEMGCACILIFTEHKAHNNW